MFTYFLFAIALIFPLFWKFAFNKKVTWREYFMQTGVGLLVTFLIYFTVSFNSTYDTELLSGQVVSKERETVSCSHSYSCNCSTSTVCSGSGKERSCRQVETCQTCYRHNHDYDWVVHSDIGNIEISRIDSQGKEEPPRFTSVQIGDPYTKAAYFNNYIKAAPHSLFKDSESLIVGFEAVMPEYPTIFDYYKVNRVFQYGTTVDSTLNILLNEHMRLWGTQKQANVITIFLGEDYTQDYFNALQAHWLGGKKNDVVIVTQLSPEHKVNWTRVMSRSNSKVFDTSIEFDIGNMGTFEPKTFVTIVDKNIKQYFEREDFHKYEYLLSQYQPTTVAITLGLIFAFLVNGLLAFASYRYDIFGEGNQK